MTRDEEGHRTYELRWLFNTSTQLDGPETVLQAASSQLLPVGSPYSEGEDYDPWAFCTPALQIAPHRDVKEGDPVFDWEVSQTFTTKPMTRCSTTEINNPLLEPYQISGDFVHVSREFKVDKDGRPLIHSNTDQIVGPEVEDKVSFPAVSLTYNSAILPIATINNLINKVNDRPLWGHPARCVRFVDARWERLLYGVCFYYYRISYRFEFNLETFDRLVPSRGRNVLKKNLPGRYHIIIDERLKKRPEDFIPTESQEGSDLGIQNLDEFGRIAEFPSQIYVQTVQLAKEGNLLLLGVPSSLP
jgi:hypothetical protein